jgi:predicted nucleic acid-binding protein
MIVVDSSVWAAYFNGQKVPAVGFLEKILESEEDIVLWPMILAEVLAGFRSEKDFEVAHQVLAGLPNLPVTRKTHADAARLYRKLRQKGVTVRGVVDCVIAQACIENDAQLLTLDRDFLNIARFSRLKLYRGAP